MARDLCLGSLYPRSTTLKEVLPQTHPSLSRRWVILGVLIAAGAILAAVATNGGSSPAPLQAHGGDLGACARQKGDAARNCYSREVGRELAAAGAAGAPQITFAAPAPADKGVNVTFAADA